MLTDESAQVVCRMVCALCYPENSHLDVHVEQNKVSSRCKFWAK